MKYSGQQNCFSAFDENSIRKHFSFIFSFLFRPFSRKSRKLLHFKLFVSLRWILLAVCVCGCVCVRAHLSVIRKFFSRYLLIFSYRSLYTSYTYIHLQMRCICWAMIHRSVSGKWCQNTCVCIVYTIFTHIHTKSAINLKSALK